MTATRAAPMRSAPATAIIVTLTMEPAAAARFTALRQAHFPPERNWLVAHVTLFHALPVASLADLLADLDELTRATAPFSMRADRILFLGQGVAYGLTSPQALRLRRALADRWQAWLGRQDRAWAGRLHVTVQNKVGAATARALQAELQRDFVPEDIGATGLEAWRYVGGPWQPAGAFAFRGQEQSKAVGGGQAPCSPHQGTGDGGL